MITQHTFLTIYGLCIVAWIVILPFINFGMGAGKPYHDWWKGVIDRAMNVVLGVVIATGVANFVWIIGR